MIQTSDPRAALIEAFLANSSWADAKRIPLAQDASTRRYIRLTRKSDTAILMDAPPESAPCPPEADATTRHAMGWNALTRLAAGRVDAFVAIAEYLDTLGLSAPKVHAAAPTEGLALIEDLGDGREFARLIAARTADETELYSAAAEVLAHLHMVSAPSEIAGWPILEFDALALTTNANLFTEWLPAYDARFTLNDAARRTWEETLDALVNTATALPRAFTLRDFHAENLLWLPGRTGIARVGLLDFQDAVLGWDAWDMAMLLQDARREVGAPAHKAALRVYLDHTGTSEAEMTTRLAIIGTLNALRITGLFARLIVRDQKPKYAAFMAHQQKWLARNLTHPAVHDMAAFIRLYAPFILEAA